MLGKHLPLLSLVLLVVELVYAAKYNEVDAGLPIIEIEYKGHNITVPHFPNIEGDYTDEKLEFDRDTISATCTVLTRLVDKLIQKKVGVIQAAKASGELMTLLKNRAKKSNEFSNNDTSPRTSSQFMSDMSNLIVNILSPKTKYEIDNLEAYEKAEILIEGTNRLAAKSPVGLNLSWHKLKIDGVNIVEYCAPIVSWFQKNGYSSVIFVLRKLGSVLKMLKTK